MRFIPRPGWSPILLALLAILLPGAAPAAQIEWIGGTDNSWHTPANWAPIVVPGEDPIQRVPQDGDSVLIADTTHGDFVRLDGDSARLAGLTVESGFELDSNGHFLAVAGSGIARTIIRGEGSRLSVYLRESGLRGFESDWLDVLDGGTFALFDDDRTPFDSMDGAAHILQGAVIDATSQLFGRGLAIFGTETTPADAVVLRNEGTIRPIRGRVRDSWDGLSLTTGLGWLRGAPLTENEGGMIDYDGENEQGVIDIEEDGRVWLRVNSPLPDPFSGTLLIGANDYVQGIDLMENAQIQFNGEGNDAGWINGGFSGQMQWRGSADIHVNSGVAGINAYSQSEVLPHIQMTDGTVRVHEGAVLQFSSSNQGGSHDLSGSSFQLDDGSTLSVGDSVRLAFDELDLDGQNGTTMIYVGIFSSLTIDSPALDNDPSSPAFDGTITMYGSRLTMNVSGGWELDGRLELDNASTNEVFGTTITVDGGEPSDGIFSYGGDFGGATIHADVVLTQNAHIESLESITFTGSVTHLLRGDYNNNGQVEQGDLDLVLLNWGLDATTPSAGWTNDLPRGLIDQEELDSLLLYWGDDLSLFDGLPAERGRTPQAGGVPEPDTFAAFALTLLGVLASSR